MTPVNAAGRWQPWQSNAVNSGHVPQVRLRWPVSAVSACDSIWPMNFASVASRPAAHSSSGPGAVASAGAAKRSRQCGGCAFL